MGVFDSHSDIHLSGGRIRLYRAGDPSAPAVILLHGAMLDTAPLLWRHLAPALLPDFDVCAVDLPRHGGSRPWNSYLGQHRLEAVLEALLDHLRLRAVHLIGLSMGAGVALGYLLTRPDRVRSAVLAAPGGIGAKRPAQFLTWLAQRTPGLLRGTSWYLAASTNVVRQSLLTALTQGAETPDIDKIVELAEAEARAKWQHREPALDDWQCEAYGPTGMRTDFIPELGTVSVPTLWLRGDADTLVGALEFNAAVAATPAAQTINIANAGHLAPLDQPAVFNSHVLGFLRAVQDPKAHPSPIPP
jgi:pimeloyl-ACP methyl ester carboxylesterase